VDKRIVTTKALIEKPSALKAGGFRFNAYLWLEGVEGLILDLHVKGFRVFGGKIHLPAFSSKIPHPNIYLHRRFAEALVVELLERAEELQELFPGVFPLANKELLTQALQYPKIQTLVDFPELAKMRGLTNE